MCFNSVFSYIHANSNSTRLFENNFKTLSCYCHMHPFFIAKYLEKLKSDLTHFSSLKKKSALIPCQFVHVFQTQVLMNVNRLQLRISVVS